MKHFKMVEKLILKKYQRHANVVCVDYIVVNTSRAIHIAVLTSRYFGGTKKRVMDEGRGRSYAAKFILSPASRLGTWVSRNGVKHYSTLHSTRWRALGELFRRLLLAE